MQVCSAATLLAAVFAVTAIPATAAPPPIEAFARMPQIRGVTISPDGSRVAYITSSGDLSVAVTLDLTAAEAKSTPLLRSESGEYDIRWCNWANDQRLLCGLWGMAEESGRVYPFTRLVAVNADGSKLKQLIQNAETGRAQFHDHILDWTPDEPDTVLIQLDDDVNGFPTVFELNINTGMRKTHTRERAPIRSFTTDAKGNVRLGAGYSTTSRQGQRATGIRLFDDVDRRELLRPPGERTRMAAAVEDQGIQPDRCAAADRGRARQEHRLCDR